jgi:hypothetical protein
MTDAAAATFLDLEDIKKLKARYFRFIDAKQWDDLATILTEDFVLELPGGGGTTRGRAAAVAAVRGAVELARTIHHGHMPEIEFTGPDSARGIWAMYDYVEWPSTDDGRRNGLQGYGHYVEEYRREGGVWLIAHTRLERLRVDRLS